MRPPARALALALTAGALILAGAASAKPRWISAPPLPVAQQEVASTALGGSVYVAGGFGSIGLEAISDRHWRFDRAAQAWYELPSLPDPVHHLHAVALRGRIHYLGGEQGLTFAPTGEHLIYEPKSARFAYGPGLPRSRERGAGAVAKHRGRIYFAGGVHRRRASGMLDVYNRRTGKWRALPDMAHPREHHGAAFVGDRLYVIGGRTDAGEVAATEAYDVSERRWLTNLPPIPTPRGGLAVARLGRFVYAIGGEGGGIAHAEVERLNVRTRRWRAQPPMPTPRHGFEAAVAGDRLWLAGGATAQGYGPSAASEVFAP